MGKTNSIITLMLSIWVFSCFSAVSFAEEARPKKVSQFQNQVKITPTVTQPKGPVIKTMTGRIESIDVGKNSFQIVPDNIGSPIEVFCEDKAKACQVTSLKTGMDGESQMYNQSGKWIARSVNQGETPAKDSKESQ